MTATATRCDCPAPEGTAHYIGCAERAPRTPAEIAERDALEARIAAAYAADDLAATLPGVRLNVPWWSAESAARDLAGMRRYHGANAEKSNWDALRILGDLAADAALRERVAGRSWHVGGNLWLSVCGHCDAYTLTHGSMPTYATIGPHMVTEHGAKVGGINVGLLP
ncbi:hypothetical protein MRBLMI12_000456 [Microbacterium sp. LMI12-1-1.1]|uniref:hypothetical protein n=1 Tax=Microbacterium sp. LMI12-1-1.1 TaxID=3135225 RepID=UPI00341A2303